MTTPELSLKVSRFNGIELEEFNDGAFVKYEDYQNLEARIAELEKQLAEATATRNPLRGSTY